MLEEIGNNIRKVRKSLNLKVEDVSLAIGISTKNIYAIERGERIGKNFIKYLVFLNSKKVNLNTLFTTKLRQLKEDIENILKETE